MEVFSETDDLVDPNLTREIEGIFADALEERGWRRMADSSGASCLKQS